MLSKKHFCTFKGKNFQKHKENTKVLENPIKTYKNAINEIKEIIDDPMYIYEIYRVIQESKEHSVTKK